MKVLIPENISDITLRTHLKALEIENRTDISLVEKNKRLFCLYTGVKYSQYSNVTKRDINMLSEAIEKALNTQTPFKDRFVLNDVEYRFIPNFDKISQAEFEDLATYDGDMENIHRTMAILFREVKTKDILGNYTLKDYEGTNERAELFLDMPMNIVDGAVFFFESLLKDLKIYILKYTEKEQARAVKL